MMKVSLSTGALLRNYAPDVAFGIMKAAGLDGVDLGMNLDFSYDDIIKGRLTGTVYGKTEADIRAYFAPQAEALKAAGLDVCQAHAPYPLYTRDAETNRFVWDTAAKAIMACRELNCPYLIVHPCFGDYDWRLSSEEQWQVNKEMYTYLLPYAREYGVGVCLENMFTGRRNRIIGSVCSDMDEAVTYIDRLNDIAGEAVFSFCYDTGHAMLLGHDLTQDIIKLGSRLTTLHMHDNDALQDMHMPAYMGRGDWNAVLDGLKAIRYRGALNFEATLNPFPKQLWPQTLKLIADTGRLFEAELEKEG